MNKNNFLQAINTLKLYRRNELLDDEGKGLIRELYVDPLPNEHVLHTILRPNTTFLIGRKGTGKSTIFQRAQEALDADPKITWAYIDIKSLYEASTSEVLGSIPPALESALSPDVVRKLSIFKNFIFDLVREIRSQIDSRIEANLISKIKTAFTGSKVELFDDLDEFIDALKKMNIAM